MGNIHRVRLHVGDDDAGGAAGTGYGWTLTLALALALAQGSAMSSDDELIALDRAHLWRPYTSSEDHEKRPLFVVHRAEGPWLISEDGRRVLDASGSWWCNNLGHSHPRLRAARRRMSRLRALLLSSSAWLPMA